MKACLELAELPGRNFCGKVMRTAASSIRPPGLCLPKSTFQSSKTLLDDFQEKLVDIGPHAGALAGGDDDGRNHAADLAASGLAVEFQLSEKLVFGLMQHRQRIRFADQFGIKVQVKIHAAIRFRVIEGAGHEQVGGIMVAFRFHQAGIKLREFGVDGFEFGSQKLKLLATSPLDESAADKMIDGLVPLAVANGAHQTGDPRAGIRLTEGNSA